MEAAAVLTIGHSNLPYGEFLRLLRGSGATAVADVRSMPYSRRQPQFNAEPLRNALRADGIAYAFLGEELGGKPKDRRFLRDGIPDYESMAQALPFKAGLNRVIRGAARHRIALMCAEHDPCKCHRCLLVGRALWRRGVGVEHILRSGGLKSQAEIEDELLATAGHDSTQIDLFASMPGCVAAE